jgi:hypothetical protein
MGVTMQTTDPVEYNPPREVPFVSGLVEAVPEPVKPLTEDELWGEPDPQNRLDAAE